MMMMMMMIVCSKKSFFVYYRSKFFKYNTIPEKVTFNLVVQGNKLEDGKNKFDSFFSLLPYFFFKYNFPSTLSVRSTFIAKLSFFLALLSIASNIFLTLITPEKTERGDAEGWGWGGDLISLYSSFSYLFRDKNLLE